MGWPGKEINGWSKNKKQTTVHFWRKLRIEAGHDPDTIELTALERKLIVNRRKYLTIREKNRQNVMAASQDHKQGNLRQTHPPSATKFAFPKRVLRTTSRGHTWKGRLEYLHQMWQPIRIPCSRLTQ